MCRAALYVCVYFAFASDSYAERAKGAEAAERVLLITNSPFGPSGPFINLALSAPHFSLFTFQFKKKETTAKQSIIRMIINFSVVLVVPVVLFDFL